jgi:hypothetical protein
MQWTYMAQQSICRIRRFKTFYGAERVVALLTPCSSEFFTSAFLSLR